MDDASRLWIAVRIALLRIRTIPSVTVTEPTHDPAGPRPGADLPSQFVPAQVEGPLYERWIDRGYFAAGRPEDAGKPPFCIVIPPPNVTGSLHIGHAFEHTLMDALTRRRRMQGYDALWLPGMDHAGIATQNVVERELARRGPVPARPGPGGLRRAGLAVEGRVRRQDPRPDAPARRQRGLVARAVHHGRGPVPRRADRSSSGCSTTA